MSVILHVVSSLHLGEREYEHNEALLGKMMA